MKKIFAVLFFAFCLSPFGFSQEESLVKWMKLEEAMKANETQPRPILIDFYTDWCGWCKKMMQTTYSNQSLAQYINMNFYPVKFNAEGKDTVEFLGKKYAPLGVGARTTHALAAKLLQNKLVYPTTLFLNNLDKNKNEFALNMLVPGYLDEKKIEPILIFTLENAFRNSSFDDFNDMFTKSFYDSTTETKLKQVNWRDPKTYFAMPTPKKKTMVYIGTDWCNACKVMKRTSFIDDSSAALIKDKFNLVDFNPQLGDTIYFKGQAVPPANNQFAPFHPLAIELTRRNFVLPTLAILDEDMNLIDAIYYYMNPTFMKDVTRFYGNDIYKKKSWKEYQEEVHPSATQTHQ